jgi:hypothetical protein
MADPLVDPMTFIGGAALDAAGLGWATPIWEAFFPAGEETFNSSQMAQLTKMFDELFGNQYYQQNLDSFIAVSNLVNEFANNPTDGELGVLLDHTETAAQGLLDHGWSTSRVYLAAASMHILVLKFAFQEAADGPAKDGAAKNIAEAALRALDNLLVLEAGYGNAVEWPVYAAFQQATALGNGTMTDAEALAFGPDYVHQVQLLMQLVDEWAPGRLSEVTHPPYKMLAVPYDAASTPITWAADSWTYRTAVFMYKSGRPASVPADYFPLGDLATVSSVHEGSASAYPPDLVLYVAGHTSVLTPPTGFNKIYDDHGSGNDRSYAGFLTEPRSIGSYSADDDHADGPTSSELCQLIDPAFYQDQELGYAAWDDSRTGADEDGTVYLHPQFGQYGIYLIVRSHTRPDPATTPGLKVEALTGHPAYSPPAPPAPPTPAL